MKALLSFGRKAAETKGDEHKQYQKANLGESNKFYFNEELHMWVEKGKEAAAKAAKLAAAAPPPAPAAVAPVADVAAPVANGQSPGQPPAAQKYNRGLSIKDRYIAQPVGAVGGGGGGSGPPSGRGLLPGAAAGGLVPGIPKPTGGALVPRVGSFFMPTPTTSEAPSEPAGDSSTPGTMSLSPSGLSMDALVAGGGSGPPSQPGPLMPGETGHSGHPGFFVPSMPAATARESSGSNALGMEELLTASAAEGEANGLYADRISSSGGTRAPAASSNQNLSFASWNGSGSSSINRSPIQQAGSVHKQHHTTSTSNIAAEVDHPKKQQKQHPEQHPHSPRSPQLPQQQEHQHQQVHGSSAAADSNGNSGHIDHAGQRVNANHTFALAANGEGDTAVAQAVVSGGGWHLGAVRDPLDLSAAVHTAVSGAATPSAWASNQPPSAAVDDPESAEAAEAGWGTGTSPHDGEASVFGATESAAALLSSADGYTAYSNGQQAVWDQQGNARQGHSQYIGYGHAGGAEQQQWPGYLPQQAIEHLSPYHQQGLPNANGYGHYGQGGSQYLNSQHLGISSHLATGSAGAAAADQALPVILDPVHPELPGIATAFAASNSEELDPPSSQQQQGPAAAAAAGGFVDATSRHQSAPGSAPHPSRATSGGWHGSLGSGLAAGARSTSLHTNAKGSVASLLPPARPSFNGSAASLPKDSSALTLPATAVAGDSSLVTTVRPSSPYARPVSPLARTSTGMSDISTDSKAAAQGFPIPSPPTAVLSKPGAFMPGLSNGLQFENMAPWRPSASGADATAGARNWQPGNQSQQPQAELTTPPVTVNGYVGPHYAMVDGPAAAASSGKEPWIPSDSNVNPAYSAQDAAGRVKQSKRVHYYDEFLRDSIAKVNWKLHPFQQPGKLNKLTPIEKFEQEQERQKELHRSKDKASRGTAFYLRQMALRQKLPAGAKPSLSEPVVLPSHAAALMGPGESTVSDASLITDWQQHREHFGQQQQQQQQQQGPGEPVTPKRAKSAEAAAEDGGARETTPESKLMQQLADMEADSVLAAAAPGAAEQQLLAPAAAGTDGQPQIGNSYGVYDPLHHQLEQGVSVAAAAAGGSSAVPAEAAGMAATDDAMVTAEQMQQEAATAAAWPAEWSLCTPEMQQAWVQWCYPDYLPWVQSTEYQPWFEQQYNLSMQQQQQQPQQQSVAEQPADTAQVQGESLEPASAAAAVAVTQGGDELQPQQFVGWGTPEVSPGEDGMAQTAAAPWDVEGAAHAAAVGQEEGQRDGVTGLNVAVGSAALVQQLDEQAAAALEAAADGWGDEEGGVLDILAIPADLSTAVADTGVIVGTAIAVAAVTAEGVTEQALCHSARVSSSTGIASQPSTATAAAAASNAIVSQVLNSIITGHEEDEAPYNAQQTGAHVEAAAANGNGWGADQQGLQDAEHKPAAAAAEGAVNAAITGVAAMEAAMEGIDGWCDDRVGSEVAVAADGSGEAAAGVEAQYLVQQADHGATPGYPKDWTEMRNTIAAFSDSDGQLAECKQAFIGWGDVFFAAVSTMWPSQRQAGDSEAAAALAAKTGDLHQAVEMISEQQLQHRPLAGVFGKSGLEIEDLLSSLEL